MTELQTEQAYYTLARNTEIGTLWVCPQAHLRWDNPDAPGLLEWMRNANATYQKDWSEMPKHYQYFVAKVTERTEKTVERVE